MTPQQDISYGISKVHYNSAHTHIDRVRVRRLHGRRIGSKEMEWSCDEVVNRIKKGDRFVTLPKSDAGKLQIGQTVEALIFIRSIPNGDDSDNLRGLPKF